MGFFDGLLKDGVSALGSTLGGFAKDIRTAITGKESITSNEREKILEATVKIQEMALSADQAINQAQIQLNIIEAQSGSLFKSGWRPAVGWVCVSGLTYQFIVLPLFPWFANIASHLLFAIFPKVIIFSSKVPTLPALDINTLMTLLFGMLGLAGARTFEKIKGIN